MPTFGLTPVGVFPPPTADDFPQYIQFQNQGSDLGGPDATTVNFSTNLTATRGTGENEGVVTVTASGGGAGSTLTVSQDGVTVEENVTRLDISTNLTATAQSAGVVRLEAASGSGAIGGVMAFSLVGSGNLVSTIETWTATSRLDNADVAVWSPGGNTLTFANAGLYEVTTFSTVVVDPVIGNTYSLLSLVGTNGDPWTIGSFNAVQANNTFYSFTAVFLVPAIGGDLVRNFAATINDEVTQFDVDLDVVIRRLA